MVTREELRVGNYTEQGIIDCIHPESVEVLKDKARSFVPYMFVNPILLTDGWLVEFGAEFIDIGHFCIKKINATINLYWICGGWFYCSGKQGDKDYVIKELAHVHILQNLVFSLTGEELTIK